MHDRNLKGETPLQAACITGRREKVRALLALGAQVNTRDLAGW
jgi:ankyrin repeat protein